MLANVAWNYAQNILEGAVFCMSTLGISSGIPEYRALKFVERLKA